MLTIEFSDYPGFNSSTRVLTYPEAINGTKVGKCEPRAFTMSGLVNTRDKMTWMNLCISKCSIRIEGREKYNDK